ncbi:hypothetical protein PHYBLDRAFT_153841 [Phycomyces blakesleeanus NRRL 1555(-)]|uniref:Uncharacterized protein n=1 Tax=Phycomyces blakesleeanus (strain ATCC 8743b / DSM 1359 / FGSC 10004 / NBRC 33097 / NRRL 1555) TaxID=763407 RepID=A0A167J3M5_PHYB8|nr:hypothetical protein PHYBLDRAFT_153841 [Phycomyces blakesleeanus NRRL 1555(-)]OAD65049.1 hypothetical protein PHYBLDRAFT_153841 [Phycomyces blakesleeanus NRRL 1555(-)]|eukprot:XP_018283089.1 hypothetical protein PHYBLDRAFT_153841 [Phycomyces blakesleeanus NRRL 1555(-)]
MDRQTHWEGTIADSDFQFSVGSFKSKNSSPSSYMPPPIVSIRNTRDAKSAEDLWFHQFPNVTMSSMGIPHSKANEETNDPIKTEWSVDRCKSSRSHDEIVDDRAKRMGAVALYPNDLDNAASLASFLGRLPVKMLKLCSPLVSFAGSGEPSWRAARTRREDHHGGKGFELQHIVGGW